MAKEIELNIFDVDPAEASKRLTEVGAKKTGEYQYRIVNFQILTIGTVKDENYYTSWMRVRTDGKRNTLTLKEQHGTGAGKRNEYEIEVNSFMGAVKILTKVMPSSKFDYIERQREQYVYEPLGIEISIDKWPEIPYKMEIEGKSEDELRKFYDSLKLKKGSISRNIAVSDEEFYRLFGIDYVKLKAEYKAKIEKMLDDEA